MVSEDCLRAHMLPQLSTKVSRGRADRALVKPKVIADSLSKNSPEGTTNPRGDSKKTRRYHVYCNRIWCVSSLFSPSLLLGLEFLLENLGILRTKNLDFRGFDSSRILILRGGILRSMGFLGKYESKNLIGKHSFHVCHWLPDGVRTDIVFTEGPQIPSISQYVCLRAHMLPHCRAPGAGIIPCYV